LLLEGKPLLGPKPLNLPKTNIPKPKENSFRTPKYVF